MEQSTLTGTPDKGIIETLEKERLRFIWSHSSHPEQVEMNDQTLKDLISYWMKEHGVAPADIMGMRIARNNDLRDGEFLMVEKEDGSTNGLDASCRTHLATGIESSRKHFTALEYGEPRDIQQEAKRSSGKTRTETKSTYLKTVLNILRTT